MKWEESSCSVPVLRLCCPTGVETSQHPSHAIIQKLTLGFSCICHMLQLKAIPKLTFVQWTVMLLSYQYNFWRPCPVKAVGWLWYRKKVPCDSSSWHLLQPWSIKVLGTTSLPQPHWLWHNFSFSWMWQKVCLGSLVKHVRSHWYTCSTDTRS